MKNFRIRRIFLVLFLFIVMSSACHAVIKLENPVQNFVRQQILTQTAAMLGREIYVGGISGNFVTSVTLEDIRVAKGKKLSGGDVIRIKKAKIYYNVFRALVLKDIVPCISKIEIEEPDVLVEHFKDGSFNLVNLFTVPSTGASSAPPSFKAKIIIKNGKGRFVDHIGFFPEPLSKTFETNVEKVFATMDFSKKNKLGLNVSAISGTSTAKVDGNIDLLTAKPKLFITVRNADIKKWNSYMTIPVLKDLEVNGLADADLVVSMPPQPYLKGKINVSGSEVIGRPASGNINILIDEKKISLEVPKSTVCSGNVSGSFDFNYLKNILLGDFSFNGLNNAKLSSNMPGVEGKAGGNISITGSYQKIRLDLSAKLENALFLGQTVDNVAGQAEIVDGNIIFNSLEIGSGTSKFTGSGKLDKDMAFSLKADAKGFVIKNPLLLGGIYGDLKTFDGQIEGCLDRKFFKNPLKNLSASGYGELSNVIIGRQKIASARGNIILKNGLFETEGFEVLAGNSRIDLKGSLGLDIEGDFTVSGKNLSLAEFKIFDEFLPEKTRGITGTCNFDAELKGFFSSSADIKKMIKDLNANCNVQISNASFAGEKFNSASLNFKLDNGAFSVRTFTSAPSLNSNVYIKSDKDGLLSGNFSGDIDLFRWIFITQRLAKISGQVHLDGSVDGNILDPIFAVKMSGKNLSYNKIFLDYAKGDIKYEDGLIYLSGPFKAGLYGEEYAVSSKIKILPGEPYFEGHLNTARAGFKSLIAISNGVYLELTKYQSLAVDTSKKLKIYPDAVLLPNIAQYEDNGELRLFDVKNGFLKSWTKIKNADSLNETPDLLNLDASGALGIKADLVVDGGKTDADVAVKSGKSSIEKFKFDEMGLAGSFKNDKININDFFIKKSDGLLRGQGVVNTKGNMDIKIYSKDFKADGLDSVFKMEGLLDGAVSLNCSVKGTYFSPNVSSSFSLKDASISGFGFDEMSGEATYSDNALELKRIELGNNKQKAYLKGFVPFTRDKDISVKASFDGGNIGILFSLIKGVNWSSGSGKADISIGGRIDSPKINGELSLKDAVVNIDRIKTTVYNLNTKIIAVDSNINVEKLTGIISGQSTQGRSDPFSINGFIGLGNAFGENKKIDLNILSADTYGSIDIPGLYTGDFEISDTSLKGSFPLSKSNASVLIKTNLNLHDGIIQLPKQDGNTNASLPFMFDAKLDIGKNSRLLQGDNSRPLSLDVTRMNLELTGQDIEITGNMSSPSIVGEVNVKSGSVNVLGREFDILNESDQENYFGLDRSMIIKNEAIFSGGKGEAGAIPSVYITAKSDVQTQSQNNYTQTNPGQSTVANETVTIITRITGSLSQNDKSRPISLKFFAFTKDLASGKMTLRTYDENELKVMILPDFVKDSLGFSKGGSGVDTNAILVDYVSSRLDSYILKGVTSKVEKALGLESFSLDYNFGRDLEKYLPTRNGEYATNDKPQFGVGFVKGFFDKVYIQVRYAQAGTQAVQSNTSLNYEITWKLDKRWSVAYYREPVAFTDPNSTYYKMTLQSAYQF